MERQPWWRGTRGEWYVAVQFVLFLLIGLGPRTWPGAPSWGPTARAMGTWSGLVLMVAGAALAVAGLFALGRPNLTALPYPTDTAELRESGPYALVRHPIYSGLVFGAFGWGLYLHAPLTLIFALALFALFDVKSRREERWLIERFGQYRAYCSRVKRLIPWVY